jgi:hypothetical protein
MSIRARKYILSGLKGRRRMSPVYVIGSTDADNLGHIHTNLCPYFGNQNATVTVQSVSTVANIEVLNDEDYVEFRDWKGVYGVKSGTDYTNMATFIISNDGDGRIKPGMRILLDEQSMIYPDVSYDVGSCHLFADERNGTVVCRDTTNIPPNFGKEKAHVANNMTVEITESYGVYNDGFWPDNRTFLCCSLPGGKAGVWEFEDGDVLLNPGWPEIDGKTFVEGEALFESHGDTGIRVHCEEGRVKLYWSGGGSTHWFIETLFLSTVVQRKVMATVSEKASAKNISTFTSTSGTFDWAKLTSEFFGLARVELKPGWSWRSESLDVTLVLKEDDVLWMVTTTGEKLASYKTNFVADCVLEEFSPTTHRLTGVQKYGMSWDAVPTFMNTQFRDVGLGITAELSDKRNFAFKSLSEEIEILGMSYNFEVLLGFHGFGVQYPLTSRKKKFWTAYNTPGLPVRPVTGFSAPDVIHLEVIPNDSIEPFMNRTFVIPFDVEVQGDDHEKGIYYPAAYQLNCAISEWGWMKLGGEEGKDWVDADGSDKGWCVVSKNGYGKILGHPFPSVTNGVPKALRAECKCQLQMGDPAVTMFEKTVKIYAWELNESPVGDGSEDIVPAKKAILFEEKMRISLKYPRNVEVRKSNLKWHIDENSKDIIKFVHPTADGCGFDDVGTCYIQALRRTGKAKVMATYTLYELVNNAVQEKNAEAECEFFVISDQVEYETNYLEAPYVGYSLSTPQLYVTTNIGYQVIRNTFTEPDELRGSEVCAVIQNSFSAGMYLNGAGDFPMVVNQFSLSNVDFTLVDSNYHPIKLFSPMFVIMKIEPTADPAQDIKSLMGKLPKNAPSPAQLHQQQLEAEKKARAERNKQIVTDALAQVAERVFAETTTPQQHQLQQPPPQLPPPPVQQGASPRPSWWETWQKLGYQQDLVKARKIYQSNELSDEEKGRLLGEILQEKEADETEVKLAEVREEL